MWRWGHSLRGGWEKCSILVGANPRQTEFYMVADISPGAEIQMWKKRTQNSLNWNLTHFNYLGMKSPSCSVSVDLPRKVGFQKGIYPRKYLLIQEILVH